MIRAVKALFYFKAIHNSKHFPTVGKVLIPYKAMLDVIRLTAYNDTDIKICRKIFESRK